MAKRLMAAMVVAAAGVAVSGCSKPVAAPSPTTPNDDEPAAVSPTPVSTPAPTPRPVHEEPEATTVFGRIAQGITRASPVADPADAAARDTAAQALGKLRPLAEASEFHIYWGGFDPAVGFDLYEAELTQLQPLVAAKVYLSLFMFTGEYDVRQEEGGTTIVELKAAFRDQLPRGDYPHPFWHTPEEWGMYAGAGSVLMVFSGERLGAIMLKGGDGREAASTPSWDGTWRWLDAQGVEQPRVSKYEYLFSRDNPHVGALKEAFGKLEVAMSANKCISCHTPDNKSRMTQLVLLSYQNQALSSRHATAAVLRAGTMPPGNPRRGIEPGIHNADILADMIRKADEFDHAAGAALQFESQRLTASSPSSEQ